MSLFRTFLIPRDPPSASLDSHLSAQGSSLTAPWDLPQFCGSPLSLLGPLSPLLDPSSAPQILPQLPLDPPSGQLVLTQPRASSLPQPPPGSSRSPTCLLPQPSWCPFSPADPPSVPLRPPSGPLGPPSDLRDLSQHSWILPQPCGSSFSSPPRVLPQTRGSPSTPLACPGPPVRTEVTWPTPPRSSYCHSSPQAPPT